MRLLGACVPMFSRCQRLVPRRDIAATLRTTAGSSARAEYRADEHRQLDGIRRNVDIFSATFLARPLLSLIFILDVAKGD